MRRNNLYMGLFLLSWMCTVTAIAQDNTVRGSSDKELTLESTVTGNQELPKILYIVPWAQPPGPGQVDPLVPHSGNVFQRTFAPVERVELQRRLRYYSQQQNARVFTAPKN
ncbi:MAG: hypothetical protein KTR20_13335 [Cellvibrionaceae bacterium]|nr:hypothetical protein [Cellvibrionaceae bacterium]